jgi:hypothetical protein
MLIVIRLGGGTTGTDVMYCALEVDEVGEDELPLNDGSESAVSVVAPSPE